MCSAHFHSNKVFKAIPHNYCRAIAPQIFRQIVQKRRRRAGARQGVFVQYGGKDASKMRTKPLGVIYSAIPKAFRGDLMSTIELFKNKVDILR